MDLLLPYVILDIFSRYVVGWMVASRELGTLAKKLIEQSCEKQGIQSSQLSITIPETNSARRKMSITDGLNKLSKNVRQF